MSGNQMAEFNADNNPSYIDSKGRIIFVSSGLWQECGQSMYGTFWQSEHGGLHRVVSKAMPMTADRYEAIKNLILYAIKKKFKKVVEVGIVGQDSDHNQTNSI